MARCKALLCLIFLFNVRAFGGLTSNYYDSTCSNLSSIVEDVVWQAIQKETRMAASLIRLHFHDCFVNGCDGSILLDDTSSFTGEKNANPNKNSVRGYEVIDDVKTAVEEQCAGVVSCADILAIAAQVSTTVLGGPQWAVLLGRRDSKTASQSDANRDLPKPTDTVSDLISKFEAKGLSTQDMVVLSGAHTLGQARCANFRDRLYNFNGTGEADPNLDQDYLQILKTNCTNTSNDDALSALDYRTPYFFDRKYFSNLQKNKGLLSSDQVLYSTSGTTQDLVNSYAAYPFNFFKDFKSSMINMGNISPLTGSDGEIRRSCRSVNT